MATSGTWLGLPDFGLTEAISGALGTHQGSWGLPELGITEKAQQVVSPSSPLTYQGGSNLFGSYPTPTSAQTLGTQSGGTTPPPSSGGTSGGSGGTGTTGGTSGGDPLQSLYSEIDNIYNTTMSYLGGQEQAVRGALPGAEAEVTGQYEASKKGIGTEKGIGERTLTEAGTTAGQIKENALTAGRRLYNELSMGGQQRFGGASSAGQAFGELTGREFQRGQATTQQAYQNAMTKVTDLKANLQDRFDSAMFNLETQKNNALNQIRTVFQEKLSQIDALKAEAGTNKSTMRLDLLSQLRNQVYQLNLASVQTQTQLNAQKQNAEKELSAVVNAVNSAQRGSTTANQNLSLQAPSNPQTSLAISTGGMGATQPYTG